jgi:uncharacterized membrane protein
MGWYITFLILFDNGGRALVESEAQFSSKARCLEVIEERSERINNLASRDGVQRMAVGCAFRRKA